MGIKKWIKIGGRIVLGAVLLFLLLFFLFTIPSVQTWAGKRVTNYLNESYDTSITIDRIDLRLNGDVRLGDVLINDHHNDTLIYAQGISASILSFKAVREGNLDLGSITLERPTFNLKIYRGEQNDNISIFSKKFSKKTSKEVEVQPFLLHSSDVHITDGTFRYTDENLSTPEVLSFTQLALDIDDFALNDTVINGHIAHLAFEATDRLALTRLSGDFHYDTDHISLQSFEGATSNSSFAGHLMLDTANDAMRDFNNLVGIDLAFAKADISTTDLALLYKGFGGGENLSVTGAFRGTLNNLRSRNLDIRGLQKSRIQGDITLKNIATEDPIVINGDYRLIQTNYYDLKRLLPGPLGNLPAITKRLKTVLIQGRVDITETSVKTRSVASTGLGRAMLDLHLSDLDLGEASSYSGNVALVSFDLGKMINDERVGLTSMDVDVSGTGFIQEQLDTKIRGTVKDIAFNGYTYTNIDVFGNLNTPVFNGEILVNDPQLQMQLNGLIDVSKAFNIYDFTADIGKANLKAMNFVHDSISVLKGTLIADIRGTSIEDASGILKFENTSYQNKNDIYTFKDFEVNSSFKEEGERLITINSPDIINGELSGVFKFNEVVPLFTNAVNSLYTNYEPSVITEGQYMDFDFNINSKIVEVFVPDLSFEPETIIRGSVVSDDSQFKLTFKSPKIDAYGTVTDAVEIKVDNKNKLFNTYISANEINTGSYTIKDFNLINVTLKDTLFMRTEFKGGPENRDAYNLDLYHTFDPDGHAVVGLKRSDINYKNYKWYINEERDNKHKIVFDTNFKDFIFEDIVLSHEDERVSFSGVMTDTTYKSINAKFTNVPLEKIIPDLDGFDFKGRINGGLDLVQRGAAYYPNSSLIIDDLILNDTFLGVLDLNVKGNNSLTKYDIQTTLVNNTLKSLEAYGTIDVAEGGTMDMELIADEIDLSALAPLGQDVITNIRGFTSGRIVVNGSYKDPDFNGRLYVDKAGLTIPYLNVDYQFDDETTIDVTAKSFSLSRAGITDVVKNTEGILSGSIRHDLFDDWELDLTISSDRLLVLNTEQTLESLYFGTGFIQGSASIAGPTDALKIAMSGETARGTVFNIPLNDAETLGDNSFIHFLTPEEKEAKETGTFTQPQEVKGLELEFDLDVDEDAVVEIVIDPKTGSKLRGIGVGTLFIEINTNGKFNMWGDYTTRKGGVLNYKYGGLVTKEFEVQQDGSIQWNGDPLGAILNLSASYRANANPTVMLESTTVNQKIPVEVIILLQGELAQPDINFDLKYPTASSNVAAELEYRLSDKTTRELNAISLLSQNAFINPTAVNSPGAVSATGALNNLYETGASILSDILFNNQDGVFNVGVNLVQAENNPNFQSQGEVGITLSTQIANRILINGKVGVPTGGISQSLIVGDVEIDFLLNEDGNFRATIFNRQSDLQFIGEANGYTQGAGLSYAVDFNTFKGLINKLFKGKNKEVAQELNAIAQDQKVSPQGVDAFKQ